MDLNPGDGLLIADVQNDFLPGGALGVLRGDEVVPILNLYMAAFGLRGLPIFASRDWHPANHCSFREQGGIWPVHCVAGTNGAEFHPDFHLPPSTIVISKATDPKKEAYSAFEGTTLDEHLRETGVRRLFIGGLATDYCVLNTVRDAIKRSYAVCLLMDGIRAVNLKPDDGRKAEEEMIRLGAVPFRLENLAS
ncbi:MAG: nicotinamidase [Nitrospirae bacterium]|nr:MAG: nicotinamidase [Nitrospirota bacterium]